ncbi:MAG: acyltransferase [Clostridia bacterium]|nr:acyltransferase [Clostridia bacterium]
MEKLKSSGRINNRRSNIELARILMMLVIVRHHFACYSGLSFADKPFGLNKMWFMFIRNNGKITVIVLLLITGYFLINSTKIKIDKLLKLWLQIFTYSVLVYLVLCLVGGAKFGVKAFVSSLFPITTDQWWYASTYIFLYITSPFINKFLTGLDKKSYQKFLVIMTFFWSILPTVYTSTFFVNKFVFFIYLYFIGAYLRLHFDMTKISSGKAFFIAGSIYAVVYAISLTMNYMGKYIPALSGERRALTLIEYQKIFTLTIAVFLFIGFMNLKIKNNRIINTISSASFAVYLIHDQQNMKEFLWNTVFKPVNHADSKLFILYTIGVVLLIYSVCTGIELLRINFVEKQYMDFLKKFSVRIEEKIDRFYNSKIFDKF